LRRERKRERIARNGNIPPWLVMVMNRRRREEQEDDDL
jgi:hypothetical protein